MSGQALVTGAMGYLGSRLVAALPGAAPWHGDLCDAEPFTGVDPDEITEIFHCAAVTRFNVDAETADAVNLEGSRKVFEFARRCKSLEKVVLTSTLYASGLDEGDVPERPLAMPGRFANHYERSKWRAERLLVDDYDDLPWQIQRIATVIADDDLGRVSQRNVIHSTLSLLRHSLMPLIPGDPEVPVYFVTAQHALGCLTDERQVRRIINVAPAQDAAPTLGELVDIAWREPFSRAATKRPTRRPTRGLPPPFCASDAFTDLAESTLPGHVLGQAMRSMLPFAPQLYVTKNVLGSCQPTGCTRDLFTRTVRGL